MRPPPPSGNCPFPGTKHVQGNPPLTDLVSRWVHRYRLFDQESGSGHVDTTKSPEPVVIGSSSAAG